MIDIYRAYVVLDRIYFQNNFAYSVGSRAKINLHEIYTPVIIQNSKFENWYGILFGSSYCFNFQARNTTFI
jgi:hypothetical protein